MVISVDVSLDMESFERLVDQLGKEQNPLPQASGEVSKPGGPSYTRLANSFPQTKKTAKEVRKVDKHTGDFKMIYFHEKK